MDSVQNDFDDRKKEIQEYMKLLDALEQSGGEFLPSNGEIFTITSSLRKTLKGAVSLLLYNMIEATLRESVSKIHEYIDSESIPFDQLREELKIAIFKRARHSNVDTLVTDTSGGIARHLHTATLQKNQLFSGNIDRQEVERMAKIYGFKTDSDYARTNHGKDLRPLMKNRNDLAHGNVSFSDLGGEHSFQEINKRCNAVIEFMCSIIDNIEDGVDDKKYLSN